MKGVKDGWKTYGKLNSYFPVLKFLYKNEGTVWSLLIRYCDIPPFLFAAFPAGHASINTYSDIKSVVWTYPGPSDIRFSWDNKELERRLETLRQAFVQSQQARE